MSGGRRLVVALLIATAAVAVPAQCVGQRWLQGAIARVGDPDLRDQLNRIYAGWSWRLLWLGPDGRPGPSARGDSLLAWVDRSGDDGLDPAAYDAAGLRAQVPAAGDSAAAEADVRFSVAFLRLGHDLAVGRVTPPLIDSLWDGVPPPPNVVTALSWAIEHDDVPGALRSLRPPDFRYAALRGALSRYRAIRDRGGWPGIDGGPDLRAGDRGPRVTALRRRLAVTEGPGDPAADGSPVFDAGLDRALRRFQARMGLTADGVVGPATREALNVPVERRILTIEMNLERWRWVPRLLGSRYVVVNIPAYTLQLYDTGAALTLRAIVGRRDWPTPITNAWMDGITFGPDWNVPRNIAIHEVVPLARAHAGYLRREGFRVLRAATGAVVDPDSVDWSAVDTSAFPFRFVQTAGPANPLGAIRFDVRDPFNVAIHDTPQRALFSDPVRIFSHGCVRVDSAAVLAARLLPEWSADDIRAARRGPPGRVVALDRRVRVLLTYQTAWVEPDGGVAFRGDVYGWDDQLARALLRTQEISALSRWEEASP